MKMLTNVHVLSLKNCVNLVSENSFRVIASMPSVTDLVIETKKMDRIPRAFSSFRFMNFISISNTDQSLADGYEMNYAGDANDLFASDSLRLGFGEGSLLLVYSCYDDVTARMHVGVMRDLLQGDVSETGMLSLPGRARAFDRHHPLVKPPVPGPGVCKNVYSTSTLTGAELDYPSGTKISIPANAFVDANGNAVTGNVTIDYREFRDPVDILLSGIPMDYDSAGHNGHFVSAGMFEMNASVDGKEVFLAPGKKVDMKFAVVDTASDFNFYKLDEQEGWQYLDRPGKTETDAPVAAAAKDQQKASAAVLAFWRNIAPVSAKIPGGYDATGFDSRYNDLNYHYESRAPICQGLWNKNSYMQNTFRLHKVYHHKDTTCFSIDRQENARRTYCNPELSAFSGVRWETKDNLRSKELRNLLRKKSGVNDLRIYQSGDGFVLEFKTSSGFRRINASAVRMTKKGPKPLSARMTNGMFRHYTKMLDRRRAHMTKSLVRQARRNATSFQQLSRDSVNVWNNCKPVMTKEEAAMDFPGWVKYYRKEFGKIIAQQQVAFSYVQITEGTAAGSIGQAVSLYQALSIASFGIFNCDHVGSIPQPVNVNVELKGNNGEAVAATNIYVIDHSVNSATNFFSFMGKPINVTYNEPSENTLVAISSTGKMYVVDNNALRSGTAIGGSTLYTAKLVSDSVATPEQLREIIYPDGN
ncbi:MAG TPA: hypothetical protein VFU15_16870, partial [Bacteroidia bacterium]|nr:hypothetical protein [Bacteroidia bacterium]